MMNGLMQTMLARSEGGPTNTPQAAAMDGPGAGGPASGNMPAPQSFGLWSRMLQPKSQKPPIPPTPSMPQPSTSSMPPAGGSGLLQTLMQR